MQHSARGERREQLFIRALTGGVLSERDYLLSYTVGEYFQELSLFIEESEKRNKQMEEIRRKK